MRKQKLLSVTLPIEYIKKIDDDRQNVSRSRWVKLLLEKAYSLEQKGMKNSG